jgi:hypothetical protein
MEKIIMTGKVKAMWQELQDEQDEEKFLLEQYESARFALENAAKELAHYTALKRGAEHNLETIRQAIIDYCNGNGLVKTENFSIAKSRAVDITNIESVPEKYIRLKKEVNKALIKAEGLTPENNNWLQFTESTKLTVRGDK